MTLHGNRYLRGPVFGLMVLAGALLAACGAADQHDDGHTHDDGGMTCSDDARSDHYAAGLEKASANGVFKVTLISADPAPPAKGDNTWTVEIHDAGDAPVDGATLTVRPWMPDHGHGTSIEPMVAPGTAAGQYVISNIDLRMPGLWEVTLTIEAGGTTDEVVFAFCVEG